MRFLRLYTAAVAASGLVFILTAQPFASKSSGADPIAPVGSKRTTITSDVLLGLIGDWDIDVSSRGLQSSQKSRATAILEGTAIVERLSGEAGGATASWMSVYRQEGRSFVMWRFNSSDVNPIVFHSAETKDPASITFVDDSEPGHQFILRKTGAGPVAENRVMVIHLTDTLRYSKAK